VSLKGSKGSTKAITLWWATVVQLADATVAATSALLEAMATLKACHGVHHSEVISFGFSKGSCLTAL